VVSPGDLEGGQGGALRAIFDFLTARPEKRVPLIKGGGKMNPYRLSLTVIISLLALLVDVRLGHAQEFYEGRRISIIVSYFPGGGYDAYSRLIARHLSKHVPGNPSIIVQNMPGAGTVIGANHLHSRASRDGTVVGIFSAMQVLREAIGVPGIEFQSEKFNWLAATYVSDVTTCIATRSAKVKNLDDAIRRKEPLIVAGSGPGSNTLTWPRAYKEILGANFKIIPGYRGTSGIRAAMERGEADAGCWQWSSVRVTAKEMIDSGAAVVFSQVALKGTPELPHVENALDRVKTTMDRQILTTLLTEHSMGRAYVAPPAVPRDRVEILRTAFINTLRDPKLLEDANRMRLQIDPVRGEKVQSLVTDLKKLPRKVMEKIRSIMEQR
jgi:tripartite-type tricarboxylate transporter receptor subunit TctC